MTSHFLLNKLMCSLNLAGSSGYMEVLPTLVTFIQGTVSENSKLIKTTARMSLGVRALPHQDGSFILLLCISFTT
jgi:hypothetical protein